MPLILFLLIAIPILEVFLLLQVGNLIGLFPTVAGIVLTGVVGAALAKREGLKVWQRVQENLSRGLLPDRSLLEAVLIFGGGLLLLTPGFFTDVLGFSMILAPTRLLMAKAARSWLKRRVVHAQVGAAPFGMPFGPASTPAGRPAPQGPGHVVVDGEIKR
jgi:UPF0716 protein FxsA